MFKKNTHTHIISNKVLWIWCMVYVHLYIIFDIWISNFRKPSNPHINHLNGAHMFRSRFWSIFKIVVMGGGPVVTNVGLMRGRVLVCSSWNFRTPGYIHVVALSRFGRNMKYVWDCFGVGLYLDCFWRGQFIILSLDSSGVDVESIMVSVCANEYVDGPTQPAEIDWILTLDLVSIIIFCSCLKNCN